MPGGRNEGFPDASFFDPTLLPNGGTGEGDGGEFDYPRGEENRSRQSTSKGGSTISVATWRIVNGTFGTHFF